jgi:hypothetical protein
MQSKKHGKVNSLQCGVQLRVPGFLKRSWGTQLFDRPFFNWLQLLKLAVIDGMKRQYI